jgi:hypothetical protein
MKSDKPSLKAFCRYWNDPTCNLHGAFSAGHFSSLRMRLAGWIVDFNARCSNRGQSLYVDRDDLIEIEQMLLSSRKSK